MEVRATVLGGIGFAIGAIPREPHINDFFFQRRIKMLRQSSSQTIAKLTGSGVSSKAALTSSVTIPLPGHPRSVKGA